MDNTHVVKETTLTVERKALVLLLLCLGSITLQTENKLKKSLTNILVNNRPFQDIFSTPVAKCTRKYC